MSKLTNVAFPFLAVIFGIVFMVIGIIQFANRGKYDSTLTATIVDIQSEWESSGAEGDADRLVKTAYIEYEVDGVKYSHVLSPVQNDSYSVGDYIEILYQSSDPSKISSQNIAATSFIFIGLGAVAAIVGGLVSFKALKSK